MQRNYKLPLRFNELIERNAELATCDLKESIAQNIFLIITSKYNEHRFDTTYGCELWDMDFELISNENAWKDKICKSIEKSLRQHERRLEHIDVTVDITDAEVYSQNENIRSVKKRLSVYIKSVIKETGESFPFSTLLFLSPISVD